MEGRSSPPEKRGTPWTLIVFGVVALYALLLVVFNDEKIKVRFIFFTAETRKLVLILLCLGLGFVGGLLFDRWRARRASAE
jgi:uncharacterized integral membrane protein